MQVQIYQLKFNNGFHLGAHGIGTESVRPTIPADTLFSALLSAWIRIGGDPNAWVSAFLHPGDITDPPFLLTSAFPYAGGTLFFPRPLSMSLPDLPPDDKKDWKKVKFISEPIFWKLVHNDSLRGIWPEDRDGKRERLLQNGSMFITQNEANSVPSPIWREEKVPRVTLDRTNLSSNLYTVGRVTFAPDCGLWFGINWRDTGRNCGKITFSEAFEHSLAELSVSGLGGDRNMGQGAFTYEMWDEISLPEPASGHPSLLLSRYHPRDDELPSALRSAPAYKLEAHSGWGESDRGQFRRRRTRFVTEGSVLSPSTDAPLGETIDLVPLASTGQPLLDHPVWRYGQAFLVGLGGEK